MVWTTGYVDLPTIRKRLLAGPVKTGAIAPAVGAALPAG
jgi:hypothetical protein